MTERVLVSVERVCKIWDPALKERDVALHSMKVLDAGTDVLVEKVFDLYQLWYGDRSLFQKEHALPFIGELAEALEKWQHASRKIAIPGYVEPPTLRLHVMRKLATGRDEWKCPIPWQDDDEDEGDDDDDDVGGCWAAGAAGECPLKRK